MDAVRLWSDPALGECDVLYRWIYVSRATFACADRNDIAADIANLSRARNASLEVTGALVFSGERFAQLLEGSEAGVSTLKASILRDPRHADITTIATETDTTRMFEDWSLLYSASSRYLGRILDTVVLGRPWQELLPMRELNAVFDELATSSRGR